ncbi:MAG TPA: hypothetical protein VNW97_09125 [Candidatus Saccharimonadales bacterium]|jgi:hypothetical protein|nr:hypothetical protein [Candidatus Saccharimonadales bacterium]
MKDLLLALMVLCSAIAPAAENATEKLPVRRVVLYKNGVGYFEHAGRVHGDQDLRIEFTSSQLNDVLKSLTVLDLNGGRITGVGYNSVAPLSEQLKSLRLPLDETTTLESFLSALRGARVQVRSGAAVTSGRLLSVEQKIAKRPPNEDIKTLELSVITDAGEVRNFPVTPALGVQVADRDLSEEISRYLNLVGSARNQDLRRMTISTAGSGDRNIFVSYISEVPVWKSTYRILLPAKAGAKPLLQGWAIVDNTVGEDWKDVELSLVAGAPQSFIQELSKPYYTRRPVVALPGMAMLTPQTHEGTMAEEKDAENNGPVSASPPPAPSPAKPMAKARARVSFEPESAGRAASVADAMERNESIVAAEGQDLGDLFEYNLKEKVTILKNRSALVPIINAHVEAEKVTLWSAASPRPLRALWITNSSGLTLDSGPFNVIENSAFAGEGLIDPLKPKERRLLSYALDQAMRVDRKDDMESRPVTRLRIARGLMVQTSERRDHQTYTLRNSDVQARDVVLEHPVRPGWKLAGDVKPEETSASTYRFRVHAPGGQTTTLKIDEVEPLEQRMAVSNITNDQITYLASGRAIKPEVEQALRRILEQKNQIAALDQQMQQRRSQIDAIDKDQQRLRENMKALKGSPEEKALLQRYTKELNDQEDQLAAVRAEIKSLEAKRNDARAQLDRMAQELTLDEKL